MALDFEFDTTSWEILENEAKNVPQRVNTVVKTNIRTAAFYLKRRLKIRMPVDTGAARASWGAEDESGIWYFDEEGTSHTQGSRLGYINELNDGSSTQAPAGFIDAEHEKAITKFIEDTAKDMIEILG